MGSILIALVALLVAFGLIIGGTRFSLYLFLLNVEESHRRPATPAKNEQFRPDNQSNVERPVYSNAVDTGFTSARYARSSLMVIGLFLLLAIMAAITISSGIFH
jgi:hypothetical protein